jgi:hypothetical protein
MSAPFGFKLMGDVAVRREFTHVSLAFAAIRHPGIVADAELADDLALVKKVVGIPQIPAIRTTTPEGKKWHGDFAVALVLAYAATRTNVAEYDYRPAGEDGGNADDAAFDAWRGRGGRERDVLFGERTGRLWRWM